MVASRTYNKLDSADAKWRIKVANEAKRFIPEFMFLAPCKAAFRRDICREFQIRHPILCDDSVMKSGVDSQPKWHHIVDYTLQTLKHDGIINGGQSSATHGLWKLN